MTQSPLQPAAEARAVRILYATLVGALIVILGICSLIVRRLSGPLLGDSDATGAIGWIMAAVALLDIALGLVVFRRRLPEPVRSGAAEAWWNPQSRAAAVLLWVLFQGAGLIASVGYLLTGHSAPLAAAAIAVVMQIWHSPGRLSGG